VSQQEIDLLQEAIKKLNDRYEELKDFTLGLSSSKKLEMLDQLDLLNIKITRMESVLNHIQAAAVTVTPPSTEEEEELQEAIGELSQSVAKDEQWSAAVKLTKSFLAAARTISDSVTIRTSG
jgi:DNA repair exonuclease SbcCD ATPase subunit